MIENIGFIGAGNMAQALANGFVIANIVNANDIYVSAPSKRNFKFWEEIGAQASNDNMHVLKNCSTVFICIKPHLFNCFIEDMYEFHGTLNKNILFISVMAGITIKTLEMQLQKVINDFRLIRAHPNTVISVQSGCAVITRGTKATQDDVELVITFFSSVGLCQEVPEPLQDAFTGMAGSGPAYILLIIEALAAGGVAMGLPADLAKTFAAQMVKGSAQMVLERNEHPAKLKEEVTSPGGTTIKALQVMERAGIRGILMDAVQASTEKAQQLGKQYQ